MTLSVYQEAVGYHAEATRLSQLLQQAQQTARVEGASEELEKLREDYASRKQQVSLWTVLLVVTSERVLV